METTIKSIRIGKDFFISFSPTVFSLRFEGLPEDVHLSLSYNPGKPLNFHVTRNTSDERNKPHISIFKIDKKIAETALIALSSKMYMHLLKPLDISYHLRSNKMGRMNGVKFLSFNDFEKGSQHQAFKNDLLAMFRKSSTMKRKGRLKIHSSIETEFTEWAQNSERKNKLAENFAHLPQTFRQQTDSGLLKCSIYKGHVIRINDRFYTFRDETNPIDLVNTLLGAELTKLLLFKTRIAIQRIKAANNYEETAKFNNPVELFYGENETDTRK